MHRNIARAYDCLQLEHDRVRAACIKFWPRVTKTSSANCQEQISTPHDITTRCFFTRSAYLDPSDVAFLI